MERESHYVQIARKAYSYARAVLPKYKHPKSPHKYGYAQLASCVLLMLYVKLSYRDMEEWLLATNRVCDVLGLTVVPDHTTLCRTFHSLRMQEWEQLLRAILQEHQQAEQWFIADTTNYRLNHASLYYITRTGRQYNDWIKGGYIMGFESKLIVGWRVGRGAMGGDQRYLQPLKRQAARYGQRWKNYRDWVVMADSGFDAKDAIPDDLIPLNQHGQKRIVKQHRQLRQDFVDQAKMDGFWGYRWWIETVMSVIKRKFGEGVRSRSIRLQRREAVAKAFLYNLRIVVTQLLHFVQITVFATKQFKTKC